jgi:glutamyl-Q tRNA(Asp) synthetase
MSAASYVGRFAPSPSGPLHIGSLVAALASHLDARIHNGSWLVRIEDVDQARTAAGAEQAIMSVLTACRMHSDGPVLRQSERGAAYEAAFARLSGHTFACGCTRREIADSRIGVAADGADVYPGTCRHGLPAGKTARAWRVRVPDANDPARLIRFTDRLAGEVSQDLAAEVGDFVLRRADGFWAYQLSVVVDDAEQGVTHVVRGTDLLDSTGRQIYLQRLLGMATPDYLHVPVVLAGTGEKLSKQTGAVAIDAGHPLQALQTAAGHLGLTLQADTLERFWELAPAAWGRRLQA